MVYKTGYGRSFENIQRHLDDILVRGLSHGYLPYLTKRVLVVSGENFQQFHTFFLGRGLKIVTVSHYLGFFFVEAGAQATWIDKKL